MAGGRGTRLHPLTLGVSKQLLPVYDKPLIYYPISALMLAGIREILVISTPDQLPGFRHLLGDGSHLGLDIQFTEQPAPEGIAQAFLIGADFLDGEPTVLVLGDNLFYGHGFQDLLVRAGERPSGATLFGHHVERPERFGVFEFEGDTPIRILEKPETPPSGVAVSGIYFYDERVVEFARSLRPSARGELEITDINNRYLESGECFVETLGRGFAWLDAGTPDALMEASEYVRTIQRRQGMQIACLEEIAHEQGWIDTSELLRLSEQFGKTSYGDYLRALAARA